MPKNDNTNNSRWDAQHQHWFEAVHGLDVDKLLRSDSQEYNFNEIKPRVQTVVDSLVELEKNYDFWLSLPQWNRDNIASKISQLLGIFDEMKSFNPEQDRAWTNRQNIVSNFDAQYREFYEYIIEKLQAYLGNRAYSQELSSDFAPQAKLELDEIRRVKGEIDEIYESVKDAATIASDTASTATAHFFDQEAKNHADAANSWFWGVIGSLLIVAVVTLLFTIPIIENWSDVSKVIVNPTHLTIKIVIIGVALLALRFTTKNYNANKHLAVVNKHRANVLKSVEAHRTTAVDEATKDAVLAAGVAAAFGQTETGYISTKEGAGGGGDDTVSFLKDIVPRSER